MMLSLTVALLSAATSTEAQIDLSNRKTALAPLATVSFSPYDAGGMLGAHQILADLGSVSFGTVERAYGAVLLERGSGVWLGSHLPISNGLYSVQFSFAGASEPTTLTLSGVGGFSTPCALSRVPFAPGAPVQVCDSGPFQVSEGKLELFFQVTQMVRLHLLRITVNALRAPAR